MSALLHGSQIEITFSFFDIAMSMKWLNSTIKVDFLPTYQVTGTNTNNCFNVIYEMDLIAYPKENISDVYANIKSILKATIETDNIFGLQSSIELLKLAISLQLFTEAEYSKISDGNINHTFGGQLSDAFIHQHLCSQLKGIDLLAFDPNGKCTFL